LLINAVNLTGFRHCAQNGLSTQQVSFFSIFDFTRPEQNGGGATVFNAASGCISMSFLYNFRTFSFLL
jgi:hypothetical protein